MISNEGYLRIRIDMVLSFTGPKGTDERSFLAKSGGRIQSDPIFCLHSVSDWTMHLTDDRVGYTVDIFLTKMRKQGFIQ